MLEVARDNARKAGVADRYETLPGSAFDVNYGGPYDIVLLTNFLHHFDTATCVALLKKVHAALKPGGKAAIFDLRKDAPSAAIRAAVKEMGLGSVNSLLTRWILRWLRNRAYSQVEFRQMVRETPFKTCEIECDLIGAEINLRK